VPAQLNRPTLSTAKQSLARAFYTLVFGTAGVVDYQASGESTVYAVNGSAGDTWNIEPGTVDWVALDASTPTATVLLFPGWVLRALGTQQVGAAQPGIVSIDNLGSAPFPVSVPMNNAVATDFTPGAAETWALDSYMAGPSAGASGLVSLFSNGSKTIRLMPDQQINAAGNAPTPLDAIEVVSPNVLELNVTVAGANTARMVVSGRRVA
jgi:hypothetical protein